LTHERTGEKMVSIPSFVVGLKHVKEVTNDNILAMLNMATSDEISAGMVWYQDAHRECLSLLRETDPRHNINTIAGMVAALSPRNKWSRNIMDVQKLLINDDVRVGTFHANKVKAIKIKNLIFPTSREVLDILGGDKVMSFYQNIRDPLSSEHVTVDSHALGVWLGSRITSTSASGKAYQSIKLAYINAADSVGILPNQLQAITWLTYRRLNKIK
jgi:hypothetical protein